MPARDTRLRLSARHTLAGMGLRLADVALESHTPELAPEANLGTLTLARIQQLAVEKAFLVKKVQPSKHSRAALVGELGSRTKGAAIGAGGLGETQETAASIAVKPPYPLKSGRKAAVF